MPMADVDLLVANRIRGRLVAAGAAMAGVHWFHSGLSFVCACIAAGMVLYGVVTAASLYLGAWRAHR